MEIKMKTNILGIIIALSVHAVVAYPVTPPHPAVVAVRNEEEQLPPHLRTPAIYNPRLNEIISLTSLLHHGENLVFERDADKISRHQIYKILTHAGFLGRQAHSQALQFNHLSAYTSTPNFPSDLLHNPELLQYL